MSAETSNLTDISGAATSPKKVQAKRVENGAAGQTAKRPAVEAAPGWPGVAGKFFEDSRDRVREAFEQANGRFDTLRLAARDTSDVLQESHGAAIAGIKDLHEHFFEVVQGEVDRGYEFLRAAAETKGLSELVQLQTDYLRESLETQLEHGKTTAELFSSLFKSALAPLQTGFSSVIENARKRG
jgi:phasin family protein